MERGAFAHVLLLIYIYIYVKVYIYIYIYIYFSAIWSSFSKLSQQITFNKITSIKWTIHCEIFWVWISCIKFLKVRDQGSTVLRCVIKQVEMFNSLEKWNFSLPLFRHTAFFLQKQIGDTLSKNRYNTPAFSWKLFYVFTVSPSAKAKFQLKHASLE